MASSVEFVCCDNPHATRLLLHMMAAFAEHERAKISEGTKRRACRCEGPRCPAWQSPGGGSRRPGQSFTPCPPLKPRLNRLNIQPGRDRAWYGSSVKSQLRTLPNPSSFLGMGFRDSVCCALHKALTRSYPLTQAFGMPCSRRFPVTGSGWGSRRSRRSHLGGEGGRIRTFGSSRCPTARPKRVTGGEAANDESALSPNGQWLAFHSARQPARIYMQTGVPSGSGGAAGVLVEGGRVPRFSPNGKWIAYLNTREDRWDAAFNSSMLFRVPAQGGARSEER